MTGKEQPQGIEADDLEVADAEADQIHGGAGDEEDVQT